MIQERTSLSIFLEGPSCSGKTCLLKTIEDKNVDVILKEWPENVNKPPLEFFLERDEDKLTRAKNSPKEVKLVDRSHLATLAFYSVLEEQEGISAEPVYKWANEQMGKKLYHPDHFVFVDVPAEVTLERAKKCNRTFADNNMWFKHPDRINVWYSKMLELYEPSTSIYRIDGNRKPTTVEEEFKDLLSDLRKGVNK